MFGTKERLAKLLRSPRFLKALFLMAIVVVIVLITFSGRSNDARDRGNPADTIGLGWEGTKGNETTDPCFKCHESFGVLENVLLDWQKSKHAQNNVSCVDCHEATASDPDAYEHNGYMISLVVSPRDCARCHDQEVQEFNSSLHAYGSIYYEYQFSMGDIPYLESQLEGGYISVDEENITHAATIRGCQACHGSNMIGKDTSDFTVWPNNGIGRINPDGSRGSCSACHSRHKFSVAEARHPETCGQCHMGPDHPQIEMYMESKHGNIYSAEGSSWNWTEDDWKAGVDYRAPTCAGCHMSSAPGVPATHDVSSRLSWELETALSRHTDNKANAIGFNISDGSTWQEKRERMVAVCTQCHSYEWAANYYQQADVVVELYNEKYKEAKATVDKLYEDGLLTKEMFDEPIEFKIYEMWHHEGRRARMGAVMQAPDYVQWHGFYELLKDKVEIEEMAEELRAKAEDSGKEVQAPDNTPWYLLAAMALILMLVSIGVVASRMGGRPPAQGERPPEPPT